MRISRRVTIFFNFLFDQLLPPILRDSKFFMGPFLHLLFGNSRKNFMEFKRLAPSLSKQEIVALYRETKSAHIQRDTDLNLKCINEIDRLALGYNVLDIACGKGLVARMLSKRFNVVAADFIVPHEISEACPDVQWDTANIEDLHYIDRQFDTVVCAHTLEHVIDINKAIEELRRVTKKRLIIVLPRQRPYEYTFDLHLHFFQYGWQVELLMMTGRAASSSFKCYLVGGDWIYMEDFSSGDF